ncbi:MAG: ribonuclease P protein subunit [Thermoplasmata archaeon]
MTRRPPVGLAPELREALAGELIGAGIEIHRAPGVAHLPIGGTIVDETLGMFEVRTHPHGRRRWYPKGGLEGTVLLGQGELPLNGDVLRYRPQDRTKRLLQAGPRRIR